MTFHDLQWELTQQRIQMLRNQADGYRLAYGADGLRGHRTVARRPARWAVALWHRVVAVAETVTAMLGAIVAPGWPVEDGTPRQRPWPSHNR